MSAARSLHGVITWLIPFLGSVLALAAEPRPRSILMLDQSNVRGSFYHSVFSGLRSTVTSTSGAPVSIYIEGLDLALFSGPDYETSLKSHLGLKYSQSPPGVIVAVGAASLQFVLRWRAELWPNVPVVFCIVNEPTVRGLSPGPDFTGTFLRSQAHDMMAIARAVVPNLEQVALIRTPPSDRTIYGDLKDDILAQADSVDVIDLAGLPMTELRRRVASLPDRTAILYTAIHSDGQGTHYPPAEALALFAGAANAPIVGASETFVGRGAVGGFVMVPTKIGEEAARLALRILDGESPSHIPATVDQSVKPIFDWQQMQRWRLHESNLPPGSEIRFRDPSLWERYGLQLAAVAAVLAIQAALIIALLYQRRGRRAAEGEARQRLAQLAHINRQATVGQLSASIAHELNQPLGAILNNVEAAALNLDLPSPNLKELRAIIEDIKRDDQRASEVIKRLRRFLKQGAHDAQEVDLNEVVREVLGMLSAQAAARDVKLDSKLAQQPLQVTGDRIQLQQVVLNLVVNGIEAIAGAPNLVREIVCTSWPSDGGLAILSIRDSGPGILPERLGHLFEPFFTTKDDGMGLGLCIARTIVESFGGKISAEGRPSGAVFHVSLPLVKAWNR